MQDILRTFGRYELLGRIARGGMGEVYLARFNGVAGFEKRCVIKKILPELAQNETFVEKFLNEGRTLVALTHSNIVQIFDMGCENGEYYLAMEHIEGADLRFLLRQAANRHVRVSVPVCCYLIMEVLKGLSYAHRATTATGQAMGIIHRDISPSNLLVSNDGEVKIIDFGIAKNEMRTHESTASMVQGKFAYMSPEQARGDSLDLRTDLFSLGAVFYELLTGIRPFEGKSDLQSLEHVKSLTPTSLHTHRADIPEELNVIIQKALAKDREQRFESADAFYDALEDFLISKSIVVRARDVVAEFEPLMHDQESLVVHSSQDFFDDAFQALLDAQASQTDRSLRTRSMCLTKSFSNELPKANIADFEANQAGDAASLASANTLTAMPSKSVSATADTVLPVQAVSATADTALPGQVISATADTAEFSPANVSSGTQAAVAPQPSVAAPSQTNTPAVATLPASAEAEPASPEMTRRLRIRKLRSRLTYISIGLSIACLLFFLAIHQGIIAYNKPEEANAPAQTQPEQTEPPAEQTNVQASANTVPEEPKRAPRSSIDIEVITTPSDAAIKILEGSYSDLAQNRVKVIPDRDVTFEIKADGYEPCLFTIQFNDATPSVEASHCAGVSTKYASDFSQATITLALNKHVQEENVIVEAPNVAEPPAVVLENNEATKPTRQHVRSAVKPATKDVAPKEVAVKDTTPKEPVAPTDRVSFSARSNVPAVLVVDNHEYALPAETTAPHGAYAVIKPTVTGRGINVPLKVTLTSNKNIQADFCRAVLQINEFYVPGDPSPWQVADIYVDGTRYASKTDMASFTLPCGKHTFSAKFSNKGISMSGTITSEVRAEETFKTRLTLK